MEHISKIRIFKNTKLSKNHKHMYAVGSKSALDTLLSVKAVVTLDNMSYISNPVTVSGAADIYQSCDYIGFWNGTSWIYAFIDRIEYIADDTTNIYYTIDYAGTYLPDANVGSCLVEWEHSNTDVIGENLLPTGWETGTYVVEKQEDIDLNDMILIVASSVDLSSGTFGEDLYGNDVGGIYSGLGLYAMEIEMFSITMDGILSANKNPDVIYSVYQVPRGLIGLSIGSNEVLPLNGQNFGKVHNIRISRPSTIDGYTPRNKKLLTSPYVFAVMSNRVGQAHELAFEYTTTASAIDLSWQGGVYQNGCIFLYPRSYKGQVNNYDEGIALGNYPTCIWLSDVYAQWMSAEIASRGFEKLSMGVSMVSKAFNVGTSLATSMPIGGSATQMASFESGAYGAGANLLAGYATDIVQYGINNLREEAVHDVLPASIRGNSGGETSRVNCGQYGFEIKVMTITKEYAKIIDDRFDLQGYPTMRVKKPNVTGRPSWNFVKTQFANVSGNIPEQAVREIENALNNGVTFWHGDYIGQYSRDNTV